jgi:DNA polymerase I
MEETNDELKLKDWKPERKYYKGWSKGKDIHLFYRDAAGVRQEETIVGFPFYFLVDMEDFKTHKDLFKFLLEKRHVKKYSKHPYSGERSWVRVFVDKNFERNDWFNSYIEAGEWNRLFNIEGLVSKLEQRGIKTYEADLSPLHRFMCDYNIGITDEIKCMFYDLETDDTKGGFDDESLKKNRILSFAYYDDKGNSYFRMTKENTDKEEKAMLEEFCKHATKFDAMLAWNGSRFDFKVLRNRMSYHKITSFNKLEHVMIHSDLMECVKRTTKSTSLIESFSLDNVGLKLLGMQKIKHGKSKIIELYTNDKKMFKEYNLRDCEIMYRLEKEKSFFLNDVTLGILGNRFSNYYSISTKVEGCILKEANLHGIHYPTVGKTEKEKYEGAFVKEPDLGLFKNVATFDFKSLYPSLIKTFNVSHDMIVRPEDYDKYDPKDLITTPFEHLTNCRFRRDKIGLIPMLMNKVHKTREAFEVARDKEEYGSTGYNYYVLRINICKTLILSFYGEYGNNRSRFYIRDAARTITLGGQFLNKLTMAAAKKFGYIPRYGDTDSTFIEIDQDKIESFLTEIHKEYDKAVLRYNAFPGHIHLSYENYWNNVVFLAKKRYFGRLAIYKGKTANDDIIIKGIETRRRDFPLIVKNFQHRLMKMILDYEPVETVIAALEIEVDKIKNKKVTLEEIAVQQAVTKSFEDYSKPTLDKKTGQPKKKMNGDLYKRSAPIHVKIAKRLAKKGKEFYTGSQVQYVVTSSKPTIDGVHIDDFNGEYDIEYYLNQKFLPPITRLLEVCYPSIDWNKYEM